MLKYGIYNSWRDLLDFLRCNKFKVIVILFFCICGASLGVISARKIEDISAYIALKQFNLILFIGGTRSFFSYFLIRLAALLFITLLMTLLSYKLILSVFNVGILFIFFYSSARTVSISIIVFHLSLIPVTVFCIIPCLILYLCIFAVLCAFYMQGAIECRYYRYNGYFYSIFENFKGAFAAPLLLLIISFIEAVLVFVLTLGIAI